MKQERIELLAVCKRLRIDEWESLQFERVKYFEECLDRRHTLPFNLYEFVSDENVYEYQIALCAAIPTFTLEQKREAMEMGLFMLYVWYKHNVKNLFTETEI
jgi:hypothetical protein